jgi:hypothetical protein
MERRRALLKVSLILAMLLLSYSVFSLIPALAQSNEDDPEDEVESAVCCFTGMFALFALLPFVIMLFFGLIGVIALILFIIALVKIIQAVQEK